MSSPQPTPTRPIVTRTRTGCWTCRARRKKCDETRPSCTACRSLNLACEGYGVRLKWAMRRRPGVSFRRASLRKPKEEDPICKEEPQNTPVAWPISLGDCESEKDQVLLQYLGWDVYSSLSSFEKEILYDCKKGQFLLLERLLTPKAVADWGALTLFAKPATESVPDPGRFRESLTYCSQSKLMLLNSLTYQITSDPKHAEHVEEYYYRSIRAFREALSDPVCFNEGMTPYAGVLLCSISMNRAMPFSIHLRGIASIFHHQRHALQSPGDTDESRELAGLIGVLDLPTHSLGRQNGHLRLWNQHCMGQKGVEEITGLPCSLIDLFASYMDDGVEERLLKWPGEPSEPVMCKIWEATQHAGIIRVRDLRSEQGLHVHEDVMSTASALRHVLDLLRDLRLRLDVGVFASTETLLFPLVVVGSQASLLTAEDRTLVTDGIAALANQTKTTGSLPYYDAVLRVLETLWAGNSTESLDRVTREMGLELGLF